jgi:hypothetical protein
MVETDGVHNFKLAGQVTIQEENASSATSGTRCQYTIVMSAPSAPPHLPLRRLVDQCIEKHSRTTTISEGINVWVLWTCRVRMFCSIISIQATPTTNMHCNRVLSTIHPKSHFRLATLTRRGPGLDDERNERNEEHNRNAGIVRGFRKYSSLRQYRHGWHS